MDGSKLFSISDYHFDFLEGQAVDQSDLKYTRSFIVQIEKVSLKKYHDEKISDQLFHQKKYNFIKT